MTIKPFENPKPGEAIIEIRLYLGDEQTRIVTARIENLPDSRAKRAQAFVERAPKIVSALIMQYLKGNIAK